ncbi:MAG: hypothetical protein E3J54_05810 [Actinobacteria bacterium]|nr:MAG: hypothetical protein E3J54_05810 [Actinomycetota bacterium]
MTEGLTVTVQNYNTFNELDKSLFARYYLGYPYCLEKVSSFLLEPESLKQAIAEIKELGLESYLVTPPIMQSDDFNLLEKLIEEAVECGLDGVEVNDVGMLDFIKKWPSLKISAGHFINIYHSSAAKEYERDGVTTIIPNSELTLDELTEISGQVESDTEIVVYGNLALGFAYDCLLKNAYQSECQQQCNKPHILVKNGFRMRSIGRANVTAADFCLLEQVEKLKNIKSCFWRLEMYQDSAQKINKVANIFKNCMNGEEASKYLKELEGLADYGLCNGWFFGKTGHDYVASKQEVKS